MISLSVEFSRRYFMLLVVLTQCVLPTQKLFAQREIAISIDDVPSDSRRMSDGASRTLLQVLDSLRIPVCIFVNEKNDSSFTIGGSRTSVLEQWVARDYISVGNHSYSHPALLKVGTRAFLENVDQGSLLCKRLCKRYHKPYRYFRFPYNDCGADSLQQDTVAAALAARGFSIAPFSIESADYAYNEVYVHRKAGGDSLGAVSAAQSYLHYTLAIAEYIDSVASSLGATHLKHIYLCHDNALNRDYLAALVALFRSHNFQCISFDSAMQDVNYRRALAYHKHGGMSWVYRWMNDAAQRRQAMIAEPGDVKLLLEYKALQQAKMK